MIERPFFILLLLTALNFLNYVDRYLVAAVAPKFKLELSLSYAMTGFVASAFMIGYFVTSPVFGRLADTRSTNSRNRRIKLIFVGVLLWSIATVASGMAKGAGALIAARVCVGVGEASYATIAPTIIDDIAPLGKKNKWLAVFYLATPVGSALGYVLGGFLEHRYGWRSAFYVAGGPGVLLAFLVLLIREPTIAVSEPISVRAAFRALRRAPLYLACVGGACMYTAALGGFAVWAPEFLYQRHKMELADADFGFGAVAVLGGIVGMVVGGFLADRGIPKDASSEQRLRAYMRFSAIATALAVPASIATIFAPSPRAFFLAIFVCEAALFASTSPINAVILGAVPMWVRATAMAASIFAIHAFGDFPSPPLVGKLADHTSLRNALLILPVAIAVCAITWWMGARLRILDGGEESRPI